MDADDVSAFNGQWLTISKYISYFSLTPSFRFDFTKEGKNLNMP